MQNQSKRVITFDTQLKTSLDEILAQINCPLIPAISLVYLHVWHVHCHYKRSDNERDPNFEWSPAFKSFVIMIRHPPYSIPPRTRIKSIIGIPPPPPPPSRPPVLGRRDSIVSETYAVINTLYVEILPCLFRLILLSVISLKRR